MKGIEAVTLSCLVVAVSASNLGGFFPGGGFQGAGFHGSGHHGGGIHPGGVHGGGIHPGGVLGGGIHPSGVLGGGIQPGGFHGGGIQGGFQAGGIPGASAVIGSGISNGPSECRYWCRTPEGQAYCCETAYEPERPVGTKLLECPDVRPTCPQSIRAGGPVRCSNDYKCANLDKCCYDRCLKEHVCKPPSIFGGHF
ncbi:acanthoscurrin-1-like [Penaeus chinensis]|uniref:acanthoscurrin-1-like n=1 Tax=Penaeus chinensis TaxID=139456 RepID=UPI001FB608E1|nr:acanthoscurrin-1-like [Penaeus chinensis]